MNDRLLQLKLNQLVRLANEIDAEAKARYGEKGNLFFESEGTFHVMDGDEDSASGQRQKHIRLSSDGYCSLGCGAW